MEFFRFKNVKTYYMGEEGLNKDTDPNNPADVSDECRGYKDTHKGRVAIGYRNVEYHGLNKTVIGIVIRGTAEDDDWDSDFDMGDKDLRDVLNYESGKEEYEHNYDEVLKQLEKGVLNYDKKYAQELLHFAGGYPDWIWNYHHAGFDIVSNRILEVLEEYITTYSTNFKGERCFWVTGHSMGGGVANLVAASLVYGECGGNADNVYCYTFATPNTFYLTDNIYDRESYVIPGQNVTGDYKEPYGVKYRCIFNIVNEDDFVPKVPMEKCEWTKYGRVAILSVNDVKNNIPSNFSTYYDPYGSYYKLWLKYNYNSNLFVVNTIIKLLQGVYDYQYSAPGDRNHMRQETYSYDSRLIRSGNANYSNDEIKKLNEEINYIDIKVLDDFIFEYSKPYQKNYKGLFGYSQKQIPAYLMQSIASAMHTMINDNGKIKEQGEDNSFLGAKVKDNQYRFIKTKMAHSGIGSKWSVLLSGGPLNALETPHYLESYYSLTKELSTNSFR